MRVDCRKRNNHTLILVKATHPLLHFLHTVFLLLMLLVPLFNTGLKFFFFFVVKTRMRIYVLKFNTQKEKINKNVKGIRLERIGFYYNWDEWLNRLFFTTNLLLWKDGH